ncbi:MAG: Do family serine endopeptidase [Verrucomicrobiae bacterium]|nr:Do family serine endopeptidase [Verrucomicrobiae bacterium]
MRPHPALLILPLLLVSPLWAIWPFDNTKPDSTPVRLQVDAAPVTRESKFTTSFSEVVKKVSPSVVSIYTTQTIPHRRMRHHPFSEDPAFRRFFGMPESPGPAPSTPRHRASGLGSGIVVSEDGYILTNTHVINEADEIKIKIKDDPAEYVARVIGKDSKTDIAVLKIDAQKLTPITFGNSDGIEVGDVVLAVGNPFGLGQTVTLGIVSATARGGIGLNDYENFIQTDASINQGNSGGALVDAEGRLIGVNNAILSQSGGNIGIGFAVPVTMARNIMERLIKDGKVVRGYLGVTFQPVTPSVARVFKLPEASGALINDVIARSGAAEAGLRQGDVIVEFEGKKIPDGRQLQLAVTENPPGKKVEVRIIRDGKSQTFRVTLKPMPDEQGPEAKPAALPAVSKGELFEGVIIENLSSVARMQLGLPKTLQGVLVSELNPESAAFEASLREGEVIVAINKTPVTTPSDAFAAMQKKSANPNELILLVWSRGALRYVIVELKK